MEERIKKLMYMAIGLASTSEKARKLLEKMDVEGKLTEEEGKRIIHELFDMGSQTTQNAKLELKNYFNDLLLELQLPSRKDFEDLKKRIELVEQKLTNK
jgi:polyhydroxyalkanoate synthesis regulator phasin